MGAAILCLIIVGLGIDIAVSIWLASLMCPQGRDRVVGSICLFLLGLVGVDAVVVSGCGGFNH